MIPVCVCFIYGFYNGRVEQETVKYIQITLLKRQIHDQGLHDLHLDPLCGGLGPPVAGIIFKGQTAASGPLLYDIGPGPYRLLRKHSKVILRLSNELF